VTAQLEQFHFSEAARTIYDFTWSEFCDWYVEMSKGRLREPGSRPLAQRVLVGVLDTILRLVHPIMPFVSESIWQALADTAFERACPSGPAAESGALRLASIPDGLGRSRDGSAHGPDAKPGARSARGAQSPRHRQTYRSGCVRALQCRRGEDFQALQSFLPLLAGVGKLECGPDVTSKAVRCHRASRLRGVCLPGRPD